MSNKQVIAIFVAGITMMMVAFWAGLSVIKGSVTSNPAAAAGSRPAQPQRIPEVTSTLPHQAASQSTDSAANEDLKYVVLVQGYGTLEEANKVVAELKSDRYGSAYIKRPDESSSLYRVYVGMYELRDDAQRVATELASQGRKGVVITREKATRNPESQ